MQGPTRVGTTFLLLNDYTCLPGILVPRNSRVHISVLHGKKRGREEEREKYHFHWKKVSGVRANNDEQFRLMS